MARLHHQMNLLSNRGVIVLKIKQNEGLKISRSVAGISKYRDLSRYYTNIAVPRQTGVPGKVVLVLFLK